MSRMRGVAVVLAGYAAAWTSACFDSGLRWAELVPTPPPEPECALGEVRCNVELERCEADDEGVAHWQLAESCTEQGRVCAATLLACVDCLPDSLFCKGQQARRCGADGFESSLVDTCDPTSGEACRSGACPHLCTIAKKEKSNVGCEYWAADLDNAMIDPTHNAQAQQFAVVVSNPQHDVAVQVHIFQDDGEPGDAPAPVEIAAATIAPLNLRVLKLGPRELDGSPDGEFNTGSHTAVSRHAYRIVSDFPVVAYQFNPLENVNVFSNDASLLKPREALAYDLGETTLAYVVAGWPQTIAQTDDPHTNFNPSYPINLRVFLTIVGTTAQTHVIVRPTTAIRAGGPVPFVPAGGKLDLYLDAFDVLNLETPDLNSFGADFTGTLVEADKPIAVFSGSEASDAPFFATLSERRCCADHLEEQLDPVRTAGKSFALAHSPSRTAAVAAAGGDLGVAAEPEYFRFVAVSHEDTTITTTLDPPNDSIHLYHPGDWFEVSSTRHFVAESDQPIHVVQVMASQDAANVPRGLPGGDPSLLVVPPREQYRDDYVFLTPDKYAFDFVTVIAPLSASVWLDETLLDGQECEIAPSDGLDTEQRGGQPPALLTYSCQLSFPTIAPDDGKVGEGVQNDGVHRIRATAPIGVTVFGFDAYVSYAYAAGTELREIAAPR